MATVRIGLTQAGMSAFAYETNSCSNASGTLNVNSSKQVYVLPEWKRHGTQPTYWSEGWLRKERLADWDRVAGTVYEADDVEDLIRQLDEAADAAQAN